MDKDGFIRAGAAGRRGAKGEAAAQRAAPEPAAEDAKPKAKAQTAGGKKAFYDMYSDSESD